MNLIASHPIQAASINPYCGRPVVAVTHHGDIICGVIDKVQDGHLIMKPLNYSNAQIHTASKHPEITKATKGKKGKRMMITKDKAGKANISFFPGSGFGFPGFRFGLGAGLGFALPLFFLASLFTFPFGFFI